MEKNDPNGVMLFALVALNGMLAHPTRYRSRQEDAHLHWHQAIAREAFDIGAQMALEAVDRGLAPEGA